jgi:hypothetical protein
MAKYKTTVFCVHVAKGSIKPEDPVAPAGENWRMVNYHPLPNQFDSSKVYYVAVWEQDG